MLPTPYSTEHLKILAFQSESRQGTCRSFDFLINPETLNSSHTNSFDGLRGINSSGRSSDYSFSEPDSMTLQLILDDTLTYFSSSLSNSGGVKEIVDRFLQYCFYMDGDIHEPRFLLLEWGSFSFECRLQSANINYSHFNKDGDPLRAVLDTVFVADMPDSKRIRLEDKKSPDVTHSTLVMQGQTISGLSKEIYGDSNNYLTVVNANNLDHFRKLNPGTRLHFPPLEK